MHAVRRTTRTLSAGALLLGLAACGPGSNSASTSSSTAAPAATGTTTSASSSSSPTTTASATARGPVSSSAAATSLRARSGYATPAVVRVGSAYEAATLAAGNKVAFWTGDGTTWKPAGSSPHLPVFSSAAAAPTVTGALLSGAPHAMFIVDGAFTGDGTGQAIAYGRGRSGWSAYTAQRDGSLAPSGHGVSTLNGAPGLELKMKFTRSGFQTSSLWGPDSAASNAVQTHNPTIRNWHAQRSSLMLASSNVFTAQRVAGAKIVDSTPTHSGTTLANGTWMGRLDGVSSDGSLKVQPIRLATCSAPDGYCTTPVGRDVQVVVPDQLSTVVLDGTTSFTAPGWFFTQTAAEGADNSGVLFKAYSPGAPYVVSPKVATSARVNGLLRFTVSGGRVTALASVFTP
ncbi:MAG: hypothetical protein M3Y49_02565 [Actinomycetota bacterium]|nr:hypothetical protein [Actinomycetota bacterium]